MVAINPSGEMQYWFDGMPFGGLYQNTIDTGEMQYWYNGMPLPWLFPLGPPPPGNTGRVKRITLTISGAY